MGQRHKHADVIIAWAEGAEIEARSSADRKWVVARNPTWWADVEYRVKPGKKYRVALFNDYTCVYTADNMKDASSYEKERSFVRWLTDWVEYEGSLK